MSSLPTILWLIPVLPLAACALIALFGPRWLKERSHWPCVLALAAACVLSCIVAATVYSAGAAQEGAHFAPPLEVREYYPWIHVGEAGTLDGVDIGFTLRADALTAMMLVFVTFIGTLIAIYSAGYMHGDPGYPRFFAEVSLFVFSMTMLVLADNFILLYAGWEGVGLCSYLLIGFWFNKPSAAAASRKAFLVTRIGDVGLLIGILLLWLSSGFHLDFETIFAKADTYSHATLVGACLLLFCGAVGKSAQFPLYVWLPDAMEGPTPVSALIHAATMVTAGVYLVARCTPLFVLAPEAQLVVACIGAFTALLTALIALTQNDLKRVLAYSTISQLGYMFLALGSGVGAAHGGEHAQALVTFAVVAAMFHLFTHAFFKALLFLAAGSVMHAMGNVIDMRRFGGLRRVLPTTHWTFLCGALALAGIPPLAGFWSKDDVLSATWQAGRESAHYGGAYLVLWVSALFTAFLTAFYTTRAYGMTFWGQEQIPPEAGHHAHESPPVMTIPLMILAFFAVVIGLVLGPVMPLALQFGHFLGWTPGFPLVAHEEINWALMGLSAVIALSGIGLGWWMYVLRPALPGKLAGNAQALYQLSLNKFHVDELYNFFLVKPLEGVALFSRIFDQRVIDQLVDLVGDVPRLLGVLFRPVQNGLVQFYALAMVLGLTVFLIALARAL